jgi:hypothetical protein
MHNCEREDPPRAAAPRGIGLALSSRNRNVALREYRAGQR